MLNAGPVSSTRCGVTLLHARHRRLCKTIEAGGTVHGYDSARLFDLHEEPLSSLDDLHTLLLRISDCCDCALVRGAIAHRDRTRGVRRLLHADPATGDQPTLRAASRRWVALDIDGLPLNANLDRQDLLACGDAVLRRLPPACQDVECVIQATASHGIKDGARLRLWFWLSRSAPRNELSAWLRAAPVDHSILGPAQIIYTAKPIFAAPANDPIANRLLLMPGRRSAVTLPQAVTNKRETQQRENVGPKSADAGLRLAALIGVAKAAREGSRNRSLFWAACRASELVAKGEVDRSTVTASLLQAGTHAGLSAQEALNTIVNGLSFGHDRGDA
ncbi:hypothetical protein [Dankookia sp. P2]|uniref:hypothetical protein n=1 Tax=Dankookia sp. P2 TaxID=3423955 RepID=UPI003D6664B9